MVVGAVVVDENDFNDIISRFGMAIERHEGPLKSAVAFLTKVLRLKPPSSPPLGRRGVGTSGNLTAFR